VASGDASRRWRDELAAWAIDPQILAGAPESPYRLPPELFRADEHPDPDRPSRRRALEALPPGGSVLDVGCGAGAAGLALAPPAAELSGVDESAEMLAAFAAEAAARGLSVRTVQGRWPDVAADVPPADVVVCHHVAYNVPDLDRFATALTGHARRRVVMELTAAHPWVPIGPLWRRVHGQDRPAGPTAELARAVLAEAGLPVREERTAVPARPLPEPLRVAAARRRLCLPADRDPEVARLLAAEGEPPPRELVTLWWDTTDARHSAQPVTSGRSEVR